MAGLFRCAECGAAMSKTGSYVGKNVLRFQCAAYKAFGLKACSNKKTIAESIVKREVIGELRLYAIMITRDIEMLATEQSEDDPEILQLQQQITGLKKLGDNPAIINAISDLERQIRNREHQQSIRSSTLKEDKKILYAVLQADFLESLSNEELRSICIRFISSVKYSGGKELKVSMRALV